MDLPMFTHRQPTPLPTKSNAAKRHSQVSETVRDACHGLDATRVTSPRRGARRREGHLDMSQRQKPSQAESAIFCRTRLYFLTTAGTVSPCTALASHRDCGKLGSTWLCHRRTRITHRLLECRNATSGDHGSHLESQVVVQFELHHYRISTKCWELHELML
jgi:hypothetical protein